METSQKITVSAHIDAPIEKVWKYWSQPEHITQWCHASDDWHAPHAENDLRNGGKFLTVMAAKDGSYQFDFDGVYDKVEEHKLIEYSLGDQRSVSIHFSTEDNGTRVTETFDAETENSIEMQQAGWQAILDNFKKHVESH